MPVKLPIWLRVTVVAALAILTAAVGMFAYRWYVRPVTLSVAVGSLDGEAPRIAAALASRLAETKAPVRLKIVQTTNAIEIRQRVFRRENRPCGRPWRRRRPVARAGRRDPH